MAGSRRRAVSRARDDCRRGLSGADHVVGHRQDRQLIPLLLDTLRFGDSNNLATRWRQANVDGLERLIEREGASIWLLRRLRDAGAVEAIPAALQASLRARALTDSATKLHVEAELVTVMELLDSAAIPVVLIKGVARSALAQRYPCLDARATSDVDLLLPGDAIDTAIGLLRREGYVDALPDRYLAPTHHHRPPLRRDSVSVELHTSTSTQVTDDVAWQRNGASAKLVEWNGRTMRVPPPTELAWDAVAHAIYDQLPGFRLARFLELAALVASRAPIEWPVITERITTPELAFADLDGVRTDQVARRWIAGALTLVDPAARPPSPPIAPFDLTALLGWRLAIIRSSPRLGRAVTDRLLEEGGRRMAGLPLQRLTHASPSRYSRIRREVAARGSRLAHGVWQLIRPR